MIAISFGFNANEMIRNGTINREDLTIIKIWQNSTNYPKLTDEQITLFLIACGNSHEFAKKTIEINFSVKSLTPEIFDNRDVRNKALKTISQVLNVAVMPKRYLESAIIIVNFKDTNYRNFNISNYMKLVSMSLEIILFDMPPRDLIFIFDCKGLTLMHLTTLKLQLIKHYFDYMQSGIPLQMKYIHFLNANYVMITGMNMFKSFMKSDIVSKIKLHSKETSMEDFYTMWVPKTYLPKEYGGSMEAISVYHQQTIEKLIAMQSYFDSEQLQRSKN